MRQILKQSWQTYCQHFSVILAVVLLVWTPLELVNSYMDAFVFGKDDFRKSFKLAQFLENFFGIIATAGIIFIGQQAQNGQRASLRNALAIGLKSWGRMWWTRFLSALALVGGLLLLIVPGIYLAVRLSLVGPVVVYERISGTAAMRRSFALTKGHDWLVFRIVLTLLALFISPVILMTATTMVPALDHWLIDAVSQLACDVLGAFCTITFVTTYSQFSASQATSPQEPGMSE